MAGPVSGSENNMAKQLKYRVLEASVTGLPWSTGTVHTAKCGNCSEANKTMFRRCANCSRLVCSKCFNRSGFRHTCSDTQAKGPFPTYAQETAILALFDAQPPPRVNIQEPKGHENWIWTPTSKALEKDPGVRMVGDRIFNSSHSSASSATVAVAPSTIDLAPPTLPVFAPSSSPTPDPSSLDTTPRLTHQNLPPILSQSYTQFGNASPSKPSAIIVLRTTKLKKRKVVISDDEGHDEEGGKTTIVEEKPKSSSTVKTTKKPRITLPTATASRPNRVLRQKEQTDRPLAGLQQLPANTGFSLPNLTQTKQDLTGIRTTRTYEIDVRSMDTLRITMQPGFSLGNPFGGSGNFIIADSTSRVSLPIRLVYQYHGATLNNQIERQTVGVLEADGSRINVPTTDTVGTDWAYSGPTLTVDMHNAFQRAITSDHRTGNLEPLSRSAKDEKAADYDNDPW